MASIDDLWLTDFGTRYPDEPASIRPALVVGPPETFGPHFPWVIVVPLTTTYRGLSLHIEVEPTPDNGLDSTSFVQCELIRSVSRARLIHRLGRIDWETSQAISQVIDTLLGR